jgi:hypothetical protein
MNNADGLGDRDKLAVVVAKNAQDLVALREEMQRLLIDVRSDISGLESHVASLRSRVGVPPMDGTRDTLFEWVEELRERMDKCESLVTYGQRP